MKKSQDIDQIIQKVKDQVDKIDNLADLEAAVRNFDGCAIKKTAQNTVFSDGCHKLGLMIIGEAPGAEEDAQGIPFCGMSGMLLNNMLKAIGLKREQAYISNTLFWRPPGNRRPTNEELAMCAPFVEKHISLIKPKLIVTMGATALVSVLGNKGTITKLRGQTFDYQNQYMQADNSDTKLIPLFHPSYLMRQPSKKKLAWQDMLSVSRAIS